jgi:hypothetical protein
MLKRRSSRPDDAGKQDYSHVVPKGRGYCFKPRRPLLLRCRGPNPQGATNRHVPHTCPDTVRSKRLRTIVLIWAPQYTPIAPEPDTLRPSSPRIPLLVALWRVMRSSVGEPDVRQLEPDSRMAQPRRRVPTRGLTAPHRVPGLYRSGTRLSAAPIDLPHRAWPPATWTTCPVIQRVGSLANKTTTSAMSAGVPKRRNGIVGSNSRSISGVI